MAKHPHFQSFRSTSSVKASHIVIPSRGRESTTPHMSGKKEKKNIGEGRESTTPHMSGKKEKKNIGEQP